VCETPDGAFTKEMTSGKSGGTGQAIRVANAHAINIYNLKYNEHMNKIMAWLDDSEIKLQTKYGVSPKALVDEFLLTFNGINNRIEGDLVRMADRGEVDILVHGTNCQAKMASGIAKGVRETFPEAYAAFMTHRKGDRKLLGTLDVVPVQREGKTVNIVNAFTQLNYGRDADTLYVDYEAVRKAFKQVAATFDTKARIGIPRIGAGLGNGCWVTISNIIAQELRNHNLVLVDLPGNSLEMKTEYQEPERVEAQMGLF
jgi:O-acetyl-ADP-ribose deacetylase (regulator of RNase III)